MKCKYMVFINPFKTVKLYILICTCVLINTSCETDNNQSTNFEVISNYQDGHIWKREYYTNSRWILSEGEYLQDSIKDGLFRLYNRDGTIDFEAEYTNGVINGIYREYHETYDSNFKVINKSHLKKSGVVYEGKQIGQWDILLSQWVYKSY